MTDKRASDALREALKTAQNRFVAIASNRSDTAKDIALEGFHEIAAALNTAAALAGTGINIKPLEWREPKDDGQDFGHEDSLLMADGIGGMYDICSTTLTKKTGGPGFLLWWCYDPFIWEDFATMDEAKIAAELHWQKSVAALSQPAQQPTEQVGADYNYIIEDGRCFVVSGKLGEWPICRTTGPDQIKNAKMIAFALRAATPSPTPGADKDKIVQGMKDAIRFAKGEDVGARVTEYPPTQSASAKGT